MKSKQNRAFMIVCIAWILYIALTTYQYFIMWGFKVTSILTATAVLLIITAVVINKETKNEYFRISFLSLVAYSLWIVNYFLFNLNISVIPNILAVITPILVVMVNYWYEKMKKFEHTNIVKSLGMSILQGTLTYMFINSSFIIFHIIYDY